MEELTRIVTSQKLHNQSDKVININEITIKARYAKVGIKALKYHNKDVGAKLEIFNDKSLSRK